MDHIRIWLILPIRYYLYIIHRFPIYCVYAIHILSIYDQQTMHIISYIVHNILSRNKNQILSIYKPHINAIRLSTSLRCTIQGTTLPLDVGRGSLVLQLFGLRQVLGFRLETRQALAQLQVVFHQPLRTVLARGRTLAVSLKNGWNLGVFQMRKPRVIFGGGKLERF